LTENQKEYLKKKTVDLTFRPVINSNYQGAVQAPSKREKLVETVLSEREATEMEQCTFRPKINQRRINTARTQLASVNGVDRYLDLYQVCRIHGGGRCGCPRHQL
jgi:hypothetical protein